MPILEQVDLSFLPFFLLGIEAATQPHKLHSSAFPPSLDEPSPSDNLKSLVQECGVAPHKLPELVQELPPKALCEALVDYYFTSINYTRYPIDEVGFRASFESICNNGHRVQPDDVRFLPLLFVVLAISARLAPESVLGDERSRRLNSLRYYWSCKFSCSHVISGVGLNTSQARRSLLIAAAVQSDSLELVLARLLVGALLGSHSRITLGLIGFIRVPASSLLTDESRNVGASWEPRCAQRRHLVSTGMAPSWYVSRIFQSHVPTHFAGAKSISDGISPKSMVRFRRRFFF